MTEKTNLQSNPPHPLPNPAPKPGDTVNYIAPYNRQISRAKVISVDEKHEGRLISVEIGEGGKKQIVSVTHRAAEKIAGNTWHWAANVSH